MRFLTLLSGLLLLLGTMVPAAWAADKDTLVVSVSSDIHTMDPESPATTTTGGRSTPATTVW
jgi:hypothetical protein